MGLAPHTGPSAGGTRLVVKLDSQPFFMPMCRFGRLPPVAATMADMSIVCETPPNEAVLPTAVEVSLNGKQFSSDFVALFYYRNPEVRGVSPAEGPITRGNEVLPRAAKVVYLRFGSARERDDWLLDVDASAALMTGFVPKGSVAIDGISLTVAKLRKRGFAVWIIPHTRQMTNLRRRKVGDTVNLETDLLGKYAQRHPER